MSEKNEEEIEDLWDEFADVSDGFETTMDFKSFFKCINKVKMENRKRPVEFITKKELKPIEERKNDNWKNGENYNVTKKDGIFHRWGSEIEEGENEIKECTVAIVEDEHGQIHTPIARWVKFTDK